MTVMDCEHIPVSYVLEALRILTTPTAALPGGKDETHDNNEDGSKLDRFLQDNIDSLTIHLKNHEKYRQLWLSVEENVSNFYGIDTNVKWMLVTYCLSLLKILKNSFQTEVSEFKSQAKENSVSAKVAPPLSPDVLSVTQQKMVLTAVQFIICFGISPNLQVGVGVPMEKRSGYGFLIQKHEPDVISEMERMHRVVICTQLLVDCIKQPSLGGLILSRHLGDILASLSQICFSPRKKHVKIIEEGNANKNRGSDNGGRDTTTMLNTDSDANTGKSVDLCKSSSPGGAAITTGGTEIGQASPADIIDAVKAKLNEPGSHPEIDRNTIKQTRSVDRKYFQEKLTELLDHVYQPLIVHELLILQGGPGQGQSSGRDGPLVQAPVWLRNACGRMLTDRLVKPGGVQNVIRGMIDGTGQNEAYDWKKCEAVSRIIAHCPRHMEAAAYYQLVSPQMIDLVHLKDKQLSRFFLRIACKSVSAMLSQQPDLTREHVLQLFMKPLLQCRADSAIPQRDKICVIVDEDSVTSCIDDIYKVMVEGSEPDSKLILELKPVITIIFDLLVFTKQGVSHIRNSCEKILQQFLKTLHGERAVEYLYHMTFTAIQGSHDTHAMHCGLQFSSGPTGGVLVKTNLNNSAVSLDMSKLEACTGCVVSLLAELHDDKITADFFLRILQDLTEVISSGTKMYADSGATLFQKPEPSDSEKYRFQKNLMTLTLLAAMCETLGPSCLKSTAHILQFIKVTLERGVEILRNTEDEMFTMFESETLTMAMGLLTAVLGGETKILEHDQKSLQDLLPLLADISNLHHDQEVQDMAANLRIAVATHGAVWADDKKSSQEVLKNLAEQMSLNRSRSNKDSENQEKPLVEILKSSKDEQTSSQKAFQEQPNPHNNRNDNLSKAEDIHCRAGHNQGSKLHEALNDLCDPMVPVQGHALLVLGQLLEQKDLDTLAKSEMLLGVFLENLGHSDSYVYLAAVRGLAALMDRFPDKVIPALTEQFLVVSDENNKYSAEQRMKIGEVLMRSIRNLGDMIPKYRDVLLSTMLRGARDEDSLIRASSLSNVAEICRQLRYSLGNVIHEVFECCSSVLTSDPAVEVRRSAAHVLVQLLRDLGSHNLMILEPILKDVYRLMKRAYTTEKDDVVRVHLQMALAELDRIMRDFLFPKQTFTKKIRVLE